jgi:hypothetical protein
MTLRLAREPWSMCRLRYFARCAGSGETLGNQDQCDAAEGRGAEERGSRDPSDSPPLNLPDAAVKKLIRSAKKFGYVAHDQINSVLPSEKVNFEQIEGVLAGETEVIEPDERRAQRQGRVDGARDAERRG